MDRRKAASCLGSVPIASSRRLWFTFDLVAAVIPAHARGKPRDCRYAWAYLFGAVCPARGTGAALVLPYADLQAMIPHPEEISHCVAPGAHAVVTMDGAGWHRQSSKLKVPANISLLPLPPYSPELNPQENVWQYLRQNYRAHRVFADYDDIVDACCNAWNSLIAQPASITSIATRTWRNTSMLDADGIRPPRPASRCC